MVVCWHFRDDLRGPLGLAMTPRRFLPPWSVEETDTCYIVRDHGDQAHRRQHRQTAGLRCGDPCQLPPRESALWAALANAKAMRSPDRLREARHRRGGASLRGLQILAITDFCWAEAVLRCFALALGTEGIGAQA
jgi:hypothetical protein